jgi:hypothetical protein
MDSRQLRMRTVGGTLLALVLMPVAWYAVAVAFLAGGRYLGGGEAGALETWVRVSWFVGPPVSGFIALWATGSLLKGVPLWNVFVAFSICILAMFVMALLALVLGAWAAEWALIGGMFAQFALLISGAWLGQRVATRASG